MTDLIKVLHGGLLAQRRPPDGLLHCSSHLRGSLRHAMLEVAGAPTVSSEIVSDIRLMTGTLWHNWAHDTLVAAGVPFMQEVKLVGWLPEGWSGTADWLFWIPDMRGFLLRDKKTIKGEGMRWIHRDGAKEEHVWQASAYWHALFDMGFPMVDGAEVLYWPMNDTTDKYELIVPAIVEVPILPRELVYGEMTRRWALTNQYVSAVWPDGVRLDTSSWAGGAIMERFLNEFLAPEQDRVQAITWNPRTAGGCFEVKLVPHWSTAYCPFPDELCGCSNQGTTKIGHYKLDGEYVPRKDFEDTLAMVAPSEADYKKRREQAEKPDTLEEDLKKTLEAVGAGAE